MGWVCRYHRRWSNYLVWHFRGCIFWACVHLTLTKQAECKGNPSHLRPVSPTILVPSLPPEHVVENPRKRKEGGGRDLTSICQGGLGRISKLSLSNPFSLPMPLLSVMPERVASVRVEAQKLLAKLLSDELGGTASTSRRSGLCILSPDYICQSCAPHGLDGAATTSRRSGPCAPSRIYWTWIQRVGQHHGDL